MSWRPCKSSELVMSSASGDILLIALPNTSTSFTWILNLSDAAIESITIALDLIIASDDIVLSIDNDDIISAAVGITFFSNDSLNAVDDSILSKFVILTNWSLLIADNSALVLLQSCPYRLSSQ